MRFYYKEDDFNDGRTACYTGPILVCYINPWNRFVPCNIGNNLFYILCHFNTQRIDNKKSMLVIITSLVLL